MKPTTAPEDTAPFLVDSGIGLQGVPTKLRQQQRLARLTQRSSSRRSLANGHNKSAGSSRSMNTYGSGFSGAYSGGGGGGDEVEWVEKQPLVNGIAQFKHADQLANEMRAYLGLASTGTGGVRSEGTTLVPKWSKASRDPGDKLGRVAGGYGRKVDDTSVKGAADLLHLFFLRTPVPTPVFCLVPCLFVLSRNFNSSFRTFRTARPWLYHHDAKVSPITPCCYQVSMNAPAFLQIPAVMKHVAQTGLGSEFRAGKGGFDLEVSWWGALLGVAIV